MTAPPPLTAYRRRLTLWALTFLVGAFLVPSPDIRLGGIGLLLTCAIGAPGILLDRPHPTP